MSEQDKNFRAGGSTSISDETIRRCLLGAARPDEQATFEELLLLDDDIEKRGRQAELELTDDYSFDRLGVEECELFARNFLVTEQRGQKLAVSQALRKSLLTRRGETSVLNETEIEPEKKASSPPYSKTKRRKAFLLSPSLLRFDHRVARLVLGCAVLLLFAGLLWLALKSPRVREPELVKRQTAPSPDREYAHPVNSQAPSPSADAASPTAPSEPSPVATLMLQIVGQFESQQIHFTTAPTERDIVRLELVLGSQQTATYKAELLTTGGTQVSDASELKPVVENGRAKVVWDVPALLLKPGKYQINLRGATEGSANNVKVYYFRVE